MTKVKKHIKRETDASVYDAGLRKIVITVYPKTVGVRAKGQRKEYKLPISTVYRLAVQAEVEQNRRVKKTVKRVSAV